MEATASIYRIKNLTRSMNSEMLKILQESPLDVQGMLISFERNPDIFALADLKYDDPVYTGFFRKEELMGFMLMGYYKAYVNGKPETVCHASHIHIKKEGRQRGFYYRGSRQMFTDTIRDARIGYSLMMVGNADAESLIGRRHERYPDLPYSRVIHHGEARNIVVLFGKKESKAFNVRRATEADIGTIVQLLQREVTDRLFASYVDEKVFRKNLARRPNFGIDNYYVAENNDRILGVCAAWDCSPFKQLRILRYTGRIKWVKRFINLLSILNITPGFPDEGEIFREMYITDYAVENRDPVIMRALLARIYNDCKVRKYNMVVFGSCEGDPLLTAADAFVNIPIKTSVVLGTKNAALLEKDVIDARLPFIDFALV
jgi:hypothetical protein